MLTKLFPRAHDRYLSLPLFGEVLDEYASWMEDQGYTLEPIRRHIRATSSLDRSLRRAGTSSLVALTRERLLACAPKDSQDDVDRAALVRCLARFLDSVSFFDAAIPSRVETKAAAYSAFLRDVRGFVPVTAAQHAVTASRFLEQLGYETRPKRLSQIAPDDIEAFVRGSGRRVSRHTLQHVIAQLRGFLRFLATEGDAPVGLDVAIDTPRVYRGEQLPRSLPWETVRALIRSVDRSSPTGRRDYAIFLLIVTYGLRSCDIASLKLDDIDWRSGQLRVSQRKTGTPLLLPLTDEVGAALSAYLRHARPRLPLREVFLRCRAPAGRIKPTAVTEAFQAWARRSGLDIAFQGAHCLRHSLAIHLLRRGTSLKTIGDLLGHRSAEATCVYLRLSIEDLREVALPLPTDPLTDRRKGVRQ